MLLPARDPHGFSAELARLPLTLAVLCVRLPKLYRANATGWNRQHAFAFILVVIHVGTFLRALSFKPPALPINRSKPLSIIADATRCGRLNASAHR
jgi:hypothetical protein